MKDIWMKFVLEVGGLVLGNTPQSPQTDLKLVDTS
jgi:hypothetical protein